MNKYDKVKNTIESKGCELLTKESDYKNGKQKIKIKCSCGNIFYKPFNDFKRRNGHRCKICSGHKDKFTYEYIKEKIDSTGCKLLTDKNEYKNTEQLLKIQCSCGNIFYKKWGNFKSSKHKNCPECTWESRRKDGVKEYIESKGCELLSTYRNLGSPLKIRCSCGEIFYKSYGEFYHAGHDKCPKCNNKAYLTYDDVKNFIESKNCKLLSSEYKNNTTPLKIQCKCGEIFYRKFNTFKDSMTYYCNKCNDSISNGELQIETVLKSLNIKYIRQYKFDDCVFYNKLPFDFYLPEYNYCIEFDGKQHYTWVHYFGGLDEFINRKIRDTVKNIYCENNNIKLIRIPYWEFKNIDSILKTELIKDKSLKIS